MPISLEWKRQEPIKMKRQDPIRMKRMWQEPSSLGRVRQELIKMKWM